MATYKQLIELNRKRKENTANEISNNEALSESGSASIENTSNSSSRFNTLLSQSRALRNKERETEQAENAESNNARLNAWFSDAQKAFGSADSYLSNTTYSDMLNKSDTVTKALNSINTQSVWVEQYLKKYEGTGDGEPLVNAFKEYKNILNNYQSKANLQQEYAESFNDENEYNNALHEAKYANYSYDDLQNELNNFDENSEDYKWLTKKSNEVASSEESQKELEPLQEELDSLEAEYKELLKSSEENHTPSEREKINERLDYIEKTRPTLQKEVENKKRQVNAKTSEEQDNQYNNAMLEKYGDYSYEQLFAEAKKFDDNSNESNWLKNAGYEKASSEDLQSEYDKLTDEYNSLYDNRDEEENYNRLKEIEQSKGEFENQISKKKQEERVTEFNNLDEETRNIISAKGNINYWSPINWTGSPINRLFGDENTKIAEENFNNLDMSEEDKNKYLETYNRMVESYNAELQHKAVQEQAESNPALASVISIGNNTIGSIPDAFKYIGANIDKANGSDGYVNPRATNVSKAQTARETVSKDMNGIGSFLYNTGMSMADFTVLLPLNLVPGGQAGSLAVMGTSAGVSSANTVIENGGDLNSAISTGLAAGIAEAFFEKFSLGELKALKVKGTDSIKKAIFKNALVEGSEEVGTDIANAITDQIINGDMSQLSQQYQNYIKQGYTEDEAWKMCAVDFGAQVGQSFAGGAISGGVLGGGAIGLNYATNKIENSKPVVNNKVGKAVKENENVNSLIETAKKLSTESKAFKVATQLEEQQKNNKKVSSSKVGQLRSLIIEQSQSEFDTEYKKVTENLHEDEKAVVDKLLNGEALNEDEVKIVNDNDVLRNSVAGLQKKFNNLYSSTEIANKAPFKSIKSIDDNTDKIDESKLKVSEDGKTKINDEVYDGAMEVVRTNPFAETVTYKIEKNGEVIEVSSENIEFRTKEEAKLNALASKYNVQTAQKFLELYEKGQNVNGYSEEFNLFQNYGRLAVPLTDDKMNTGFNLNPDQKMGAYEAGLTSRKSYYQEQNIISSNAKNSKYYAYTKGKFNASAIKGIQLDETQRAFYNFFREFALRTGINVELFSSKEKSGKYQGEQGSWNKNTKTIRVDINAGLMSVKDRAEIKHGMLNTFSHELTHIAELSGFYDELHEAIVNALEKRGTDFNELVKAKKDEMLRTDPKAKTMSDEKLTYLADVEVIANNCETMLKNSKIFEDIAQGNPTLAQKIKDKLKNFIARLKQLLNKTNALTPEGKLLEECVTEFENINRIWDKAVTDGIKKVNAVQAEQKNNTADNSDVKNSIRNTKDITWDEQINNYFLKNGLIKHSDTLVVNKNTPDYLLSYVDNIPLALPISVISKAQSKKDISHSVNDLNIKKIQSGVSNSIATIYNKSRNSILFITDIKQGEYPLVVAFEINSVFDGDSVHKCTSIHLRTNLDAYLSNLNGTTVFVKNKNELNALCREVNILDRLQKNNKLIDVSLSQENKDVKYQFGGRKAETANNSLLDKAIEMENRGKDSEIIRQKTGWFRGMDSKWRFEIDDSKMRFYKVTKQDIKNIEEYKNNKIRYNGLSRKIANNTATTEQQQSFKAAEKYIKEYETSQKLSDYVSHSELFKAYPQLKEVNFYFDTISAKGAYYPDSNAIVINPTLSQVEQRESVIHEIQHAIQNIEGFADGSTMSQWQNKGADSFTAYSNYRNTAGEIEARDTASRLNFNAEQRKNNRPDIDRKDIVFSEGGVSCYVGYTTDNKPVAVINDNILAEVPKSQWIKTVKETISEKFANGVPIKGRFIKVNRITRNEFVNSKYSQHLKQFNKVIYKDKFKSANNLDEIIIASTNYINEDLKHSRKDKFKEFARGNVLIRVGKNDYSANVIIGFTSANNMVLYDIIDFIPTNLKIKKVDTHTAQQQNKNAESSRTSVSTNNNVSQNNNNVKHSVNVNGEEHSNLLFQSDIGRKDVVFADNNSNVKNQLRSIPEEKEIAANIKTVANMKPVATLSGNEFSKSKTDLVTQVTDYFDEIGGYVNTEYGNIELTKSGVKSSIGHGIGRNKAIAFKAVPDVLKEGKIIDFQKNWKNRGYDTAVFAAPIKIADKDYFMAAVIVVEAERNSYYLHEVAIQEKEDNTLFKTGTVNNGTSGKVLSSPIFTLLQKLQSVKNESEDNTEYQSRTADIDNEYLEAVKNNDLETAQKLVDETAKENGYTIKAYHGTTNQQEKSTWNDKMKWYDTEYKHFTVFKKQYDEQAGHFFNDDIDNAGGYGSILYSVYLKINKPLVIDCNGQNYASITFDGKDMDTYEWAEYAKKHRYDGVIFKNISDGVGYDDLSRLTTDYVVFNSNQIKSSEPITYDDKGNVIPLSKRFINYSVDIRYQSRNTKPDYNFSKALSNREWSSFYSSLEKSNQRDSFRIGNYGVIIPDEKNPDNYKLVYYDGDSVNPSVKAVYKLENYDYNIHDEQFDFETILKALEGKDESEEFAETVLDNCKSVYGTIFRKYEAKSCKFINISRKYNKTLQHNSVEPDRTGTIENTEQGISDSRVDDDFPQFQMRPDNGFANRRLLANALEKSAQNNYEKNKVKLYKENIDRIDELEARLDEVNEKIKKASSVKAAERTREQRTELMKLKNRKKILQDKIVRKDKQLLNFESMEPMKKLIESEKRKAKHEAQINYEAKLKDEREKHNAELASVKERDRERIADVIERKDKIIVAEREKRKTMVKGVRDARDKKEIIRKTIKKIKDIDKLLNRSKADKTVKQGLRDTASKLLSLKDILLDTNLSNADIVRRGIEIATPDEQKLLKEYLSIIGETDTELSEVQRRKVYQLNSKLKDLFIRERERLNRATVKQALTELSEIYKSVENAPEAYLRNSFDKNIIEAIDNLKEEIGGTLVKDMNVEQVQELHDIVTMILTSIRNANKHFAENIKTTCEETSSNVINEILSVKGTKEVRNLLANKILDFQWRNLKPIYAFRLMGSKTFEKIYWNLQKGELDWYIDIAEAKQFKEECEEKYGYKSFDFKKTFEFTAMDGRTFTLDLNQMMDIYAASRRTQALQHLLKGGFTFEKDSADGKLKVKTGAKAYPLTMSTIQSIANGLSENEKGYAEEMQKYLSEVMAKKGNEVSMALYGVEMFNEDTYWSISSSDTFLKVEENETTGEFKVKNFSFTKSTIRNASNPIVLRGFEENWCNHVNQMSLYHAMTLPLEDFTKIFNYNTGVRTNEENPTAVTGVRSVIKGAFGNSAEHYFRQFIRDLNGGIREASRVGIADNMIALSKKAAVFANFSVFLQQPSAIFRAWAYVDKRYFLPEPNKLVRLQNHHKDWEQLKKYAPIAGIKEMGMFDTGTGKGVLEWLSSGKRDSVVKKTQNKIDDVGSWLPAKADEYAWVKLWHAIQRETRVKYGLAVGTEENLIKSGERFNEVVHLTQVYDSVFSRSGAMRSSQTFDKMATSFMAEPTTIMNMAVDAVVQLKRNGKSGIRQFAKSASAILISIFANTLLKSVITAGRDDDEDETYSDKYWQAFCTDLINSAIPLNYYPIMRDLVSVIEGYTTERMDMSLVSDFVVSLKKLLKEDGATANNLIDFVGYIANLFGLPMRNVVRDFRAVFNTYNTLTTASKDPITSLEMSMPTDYQEAYDKYWKEGYTEEDCESKAATSVKSKIRKKLRPVYLEALKNQDSATVANIRRYMRDSGFYNSLNDVDEVLKGWRESSEEEEERAQRAEERK